MHHNPSGLPALLDENAHFVKKDTEVLVLNIVGSNNLYCERLQRVHESLSVLGRLMVQAFLSDIEYVRDAKPSQRSTILQGHRSTDKKSRVDLADLIAHNALPAEAE